MDTKKKAVHIMGILGSGASACAVIAKAQGYSVSGCDTSAYSEYKDELLTQGIHIDNLHNPAHLEVPIDTLIISPAIEKIAQDNFEYVTATRRGIPVLTWQSFTGQHLMENKFVIAVAGTHGKSTTTALIGLILEAAGVDPTVQLGAIVPQWQRNYRVGHGEYYVIEADEFNDNFSHYTPHLIAVTNIEYDHPEHFASEEVYRDAFRSFVQKLPEHAMVISPDPLVESFGSKTIEPFLPQDIVLPLIGAFNRENAAVAATVAKAIGVSDAVIKEVLESFSGLSRRFSLAGEVNGIPIYDDYAHHPTAILKTAQAAYAAFSDRKIWLVYQPHMFTRTQALLSDFVTTFTDVPVAEVLICDIFAAREPDTGIINSQDIVNRIQKPNVRYGGSLLNAENMLTQEVKTGDVIINMGAGDITQLSQELLKNLPKHRRDNYT